MSFDGIKSKVPFVIQPTPPVTLPQNARKPNNSSHPMKHLSDMVEAISSRPPPQLKPKLVIRSSKV